MDDAFYRSILGFGQMIEKKNFVDVVEMPLLQECADPGVLRLARRDLRPLGRCTADREEQEAADVFLHP
jgi:hypothetical protein